MICTKCKRDLDLCCFRVQSGRRGLARVCIDCDKEYTSSHYRKHTNRAKEDANMRYYGLLEEDYKNLLLAQDGKCAICKCILTNVTVDHDHETDAIRGLLCNECNLGLGNFKDNLSILESAMKYLASAPKKASLKTLLASMLWSK